MGLLEGTSVYLVGPVDHSDDPHKWRRDITHNLLKPMGVKVYDPLIKPSWFTKHYNNDIKSYKKWLMATQIRAKEAIFDKATCGEILDNTWNSFKIVHQMCLRMANDCNFMIVHLPKEFTAGSFQEIEMAARARKPIFFHLPDGYETSTWLPPQVYDDVIEFSEYCFTDWQKLYDKIKSIDSGDVLVDKLRWIFLSYFNDKDVIDEFSSNK